MAFLGTPEFAAVHLRALLDAGVPIAAVYTNPDRARARHRSTLVAPEVKVAAAEAGIEVVQPTNPRKRAFVDEFVARQFDLAIVVAYGHLLPPRLIDSPRLGSVNLHASLLPRWRGAAPAQWALMAGDHTTGVTLQRIVRQLDAGPVIATRRHAIDPSCESAEQLRGELAEVGAGLLVESLPGLLDGSLLGQASPQDERAVTVAPALVKGDGDVDWHIPAAAIVNRLRGITPWPGAWATLPAQGGGEQRRLRLHRCRVVADGESTDAPPERDRLDSVGSEPTVEPSGSATRDSASGEQTGSGSAAAGTVLRAKGDDLWIATGGGVLAIDELQPAGKRAMPTRAYLAGHALESGLVLPSLGTWAALPPHVS